MTPDQVAPPPAALAASEAGAPGPGYERSEHALWK
jgi:hypothetical protein